MDEYYKGRGFIWDGLFTKLVSKTHKISFCTTCMDRLYNLKETLSLNIENNISYPKLEFVVIDYNSKDDVGGWIKANMMHHIKSGLLVYYRTTEPKYFSMSHSRNIAFKVATGDIVNNIDADNYTFDIGGKREAEENLAFYINRMANEAKDRKVIFAKGKRAMHGRIGFYKEEFISELGGYDESLIGYGHDDHDLVVRAWKLGYSMYWWGGTYFSRIKTSRAEKNANMAGDWKTTERENKAISVKNVTDGKFKANEGVHWGKANLIKNFKTEISI
jgi:hypothetical protein